MMMPMPNSNHAREKIERLIESTDSARDKAFLMILMQISDDLAADTEAIGQITKDFSEHKTKFDSHVIEEQALFQQGRGLYKAMGWTFGGVASLVAVIIGMGIYTYQTHTGQNERDQHILLTDSGRITALEERMRNMETLNQQQVAQSAHDDLERRVTRIENRMDQHALDDNERFHGKSISPALQPQRSHP